MPRLSYWKAVLLVVLLITAGCARGRASAERQVPLTPMQRGAMQTRELNGDFETAFSATISVLQDTGWQIDEVDKSSGIVQASSLKRQDVVGPQEEALAASDPRITELRRQMQKGKTSADWTRWERLTVHLEPWGKDTVRERISIVKCGAAPERTVTQREPRFLGLGSKKQALKEPAIEQSVVLENPRAYQALFQEIQKAVFIRQGLEGK